MAEKKVLTEDEAQEMLERYYQRPLFEATVLLKLARRQVGNKNVTEMLEAMRVVFLSDISVKLSNLLQGNPKLKKDGFNLSTYLHLFPLMGGKCIDFSKTPVPGKSACPIVDTPADALFTWCSPVTAEQYEQITFF